MELTSVYVGVEEMDRAVFFYEALFEQSPAQHEERFSRFEFGSVDFGLYNAGYDGFDLEFGNNCVPNFEVVDIEEAWERIDQIAPEIVHDEIQVFGDYRTFHFIDTEGNEIEVFSIDSSSS